MPKNVSDVKIFIWFLSKGQDEISHSAVEVLWKTLQCVLHIQQVSAIQ